MHPNPKPVITVPDTPISLPSPCKVMEVLGKGAEDTITYPEFRRWACLCPSWQVWRDSVTHTAPHYILHYLCNRPEH